MWECRQTEQRLSGLASILSGSHVFKHCGAARQRAAAIWVWTEFFVCGAAVWLAADSQFKFCRPGQTLSSAAFVEEVLQLKMQEFALSNVRGKVPVENNGWDVGKNCESGGGTEREFDLGPI